VAICGADIYVLKRNVPEGTARLMDEMLPDYHRAAVRYDQTRAAKSSLADGDFKLDDGVDA